MVSAQSSREQTQLATQQLPGAFGTPESRRIAQQFEGLLQGGATSPFQGALRSAILQPSFAATGPEAQQIRGIANLVQGGAATRGLGPATQAAVASAVAPAVAGLQQAKVGELQSALTGDIEAQLGRRGIDIGGLAELTGLAQPQVLTGQRGTSKGGGGSIGSGAVSLFTRRGGGGTTSTTTRS